MPAVTKPGVARRVILSLAVVVGVEQGCEFLMRRAHDKAPRRLLRSVTSPDGRWVARALKVGGPNSDPDYEVRLEEVGQADLGLVVWTSVAPEPTMLSWRGYDTLDVLVRPYKTTSAYCAERPEARKTGVLIRTLVTENDGVEPLR